MIEINLNHFITKPYPHQIDSIKHILNAYHDVKRPKGSELFSANFDEMGVGKSKPHVDGLVTLYENNIIDTVIVVCPASVRGVWDNAETGEIAKHCSANYAVLRYDASFKGKSFPESKGSLLWVTVSYSFLRARLKQFLGACTGKNARKFFVIFDESSFIKSPKAQQTRACKELRQYATGAAILNGTPIANNVLDLWSQFDILDPNALGKIGFYHFRARYCLMGGFEGKEVLNIKEEKEKALKRIAKPKNEQDLIWAEEKLEKIASIEAAIQRLQDKLKPWVIRREKKDVLKHLPPKLPPVFLEAQMSTEGYRVYEEMLEDMVAWVDSAEYSQAVNGAVKVGRLSQITSGFLGGIKQIEEDEDYTQEDNLNDLRESLKTSKAFFISPIKEVDDAKLKTFLEWYQQNRHLKVVVWCRFRAEMFRLEKALQQIGCKTGMIIGGQPTSQREQVIKDATDGNLDVVIANPASGGFGLNGLQIHFHTCVYMSLSHSLIHYLQSSDRLDRPGQSEPISYIFILAVSPKGNKTVDHLVVKSVLGKDDLAKWSMQRWKEEVRNL
jgi:SNF2 family DNA or RNA helicase